MTSLIANFLVGPTATGKSSVAFRIAEEDGYEIVSADSMAVYRGMDIGTAKPSADERRRVRHRCLDLAEPGQSFSVGEYHKEAITALTRIVEEGRGAIVVGGTGLYVKALTHGLSRLPPADPGYREQLSTILKEEGPESLALMLEATGPEMYASLSDKKNPRRLIRALELVHLGVREPAEKWTGKARGPVIVGLKMPRNQLRLRIAERVKAMYAGGLVEEVEALLASGSFEGSPTARHAIGYAEAVDFLRHECSLEDAIERTAARTSQLAKRQESWFSHQANTYWIDLGVATDLDYIVNSVRKAWKHHGPTPIAGQEG